MEFPSYPKVLRIGHRDLEHLLEGRVLVQEKIDGSQINWTWDKDFKLHVKSKGTWQLGGPDNRLEPDALFSKAISYLLTLEPPSTGLFFRGEAVNKPRHNSLTYTRVPDNNIVLFDAVDVNWNPYSIGEWASAMGLEPVAEVFEGPGSYLAMGADSYLERESMLGGKIEGIVIKNYGMFGLDGKPLIGKLVRDEFKELHARQWKSDNPTRSDQIQLLIEALNTEARFAKAVQHLEERGELVGAEQDIGKLMQEVKRDILEEETAWITERLVKTFMPQITRSMGRGLPEWYKERLAASS